MTPEENAQVAGAHRGDFKAEELRPDERPTAHRPYGQVPGGMTDSIWYLAAANLVPHGLHRREREMWIEGFIAGLEAARGIDQEPGVGGVLRETICEVTLDP